MAGFIGRNISLTWGGAAQLGIREKGVKINGEPIDATSGEDLGWRLLLTEAGENTIDISLSGVTKSKTWKTDFFAGNRTKAVVITYTDGGVISGTFFLASYNETLPYKDATSFDITLQSTGTVVYTP